MYGHQTRLSCPETRVKTYFGGEIMACHTQQTKQNKNLLVIHFIYKYEPDPTKSQQNTKDRPLLCFFFLFKKKNIELILGKFHFPKKV